MLPWNPRSMLDAPSTPFLIGVSGGAASGKSAACEKIINQLTVNSNGKKAIIMSLSSFYRELTPEEKALAEKGEFDLDHPNSFDFKLLSDTLVKIKQHTKVSINIYDCSAYSNTPIVQSIPEDVDVVIVEGILTFYQKEVRELFDLKIFVESDADTRLSRKVLTDVQLKGRSVTDVLDNYFKFVKPAFEEFCLPTKKHADMILPRQPDNDVGVKLITEHLLQVISDRPQTSAWNCRRARNQSESAAAPIRPH